MSKNKKQGGSLQEQLRQSGLVTSKQLRKAEKGIHRQEMRVKQGVSINENKLAVQQAQAAKLAADKKMNAEKNEKAQTKAIFAQVKQLVEMNSQRQEGDVEYNFTEQSKVKKIYVSNTNKMQLNKGFLAIVKIDDRYDLVPEKVARKIMGRREDVVLYLYDRSSDMVDEDDPYKDFQIPDDLEW